MGRTKRALLVCRPPTKCHRNVFGQPRRLLGHLLSSVLAEVAMAQLVDGLDLGDRLRLGHCHQCDRRWLPTDAPAAAAILITTSS